MNHCLTCEGINQFIQSEIIGEKLENVELEKLIEISRGWDLQLIVISYLLTIALLNIKKNDSEEILSHLLRIFELKDEMYLEIDEIDYDFILYMIRHIKNDHLTLEEELIELKCNMSRFSYERALRY